MGAAQLLQSVSAEPIFCAVVVESPFSDLREIAYDRVGQFFHTGDWLGRTLLRPVIEIAFLYSRWKYGFDLERVSPMTMVSASKIPVLMIHGKIDSNIPLRHSRRIKSAASAAVLWEVPHADHCGAINLAPEEFVGRVLDWFGNHSLSPRVPPWLRLFVNHSTLHHEIHFLHHADVCQWIPRHRHDIR
jgi:uncharacterized protein